MFKGSVLDQSLGLVRFIDKWKEKKRKKKEKERRVREGVGGKMLEGFISEPKICIELTCIT